MGKVQKRWVAAGVLVVGAGALVVGLRHKASPMHTPPPEEADRDTHDRHWGGFTATHPELAGPTAGAPNGPAAGSWLAPVISPQQLEEVMDLWRKAILTKNTQMVLELDQAFAVAPLRFGPALATVAEHDGDARVRAFSTRVLGKYKNGGLVDVFQHLLGDQSPYVRQNAAWALGELGATADGRVAVDPAIADLEQVQGADREPDVRKAATEALKRLQ